MYNDQNGVTSKQSRNSAKKRPKLFVCYTGLGSAEKNAITVFFQSSQSLNKLK